MRLTMSPGAAGPNQVTAVVTDYDTGAPAQVDRLEAGAMLRAKLSQLWEDRALQRIPLVLQIAKGGADEDTEGLAVSCHRFALSQSDNDLLRRR